MGYEIRIVSSEEFDSLPYKRAKSSLGLADAKTNIAYVRNTGVRELDENTISHEFDELLMKVSPHEEDGIRYKAWIPWLVSTAIAAAKSAAVGAAVGGVVSKAKGGKFWAGAGQGAKWGALGSGAGSLIGGAGSAIGGGLGSGLSKVGSLMGGSQGGFGGTVVSSGGKFAGGISSGSAVGTSAPGLAGFAGGTGSAVSGLASAAAQGGKYAGGAGSGGASALSNALPAGQSLLSKFGSFAKGKAESFGADFLKDKAASALSSDSGQLQQQGAPAGGSSLSYGGPAALARFNPSLGGEGPITQQQYQTGISNIGFSKQSKISDLFRTPAFRGQTPEENSSLANQLTSANLGYDQELQQYNADILKENQRREYRAVQSSNNISNAQMKIFIDLAQKDDATISSQVANSPEEFRAIFKHLIFND